MSNTFKVHRVRFVPYEPKAIHCLAVEGGDEPRLAVSRADSSIEIWRITTNRYFREMKFPGCKGMSVEALVWSGSRLFSSGLHGEITEWDFDKLCVRTSVDSYGGAVWSLAINHEQSLMAAGCEDGCVRLFNITLGELEFARIFSKQEGRILSLCWHKDGQVLVAGGSDGTIRVYQVSTGHARLRITLDNFTQRNTLVWALAITSDFTIISGDSLGNTQFWDGKFGTMIKKFNAHIADVLAICINKSEDTVYSSGVDNKLVEFKLIDDKDGEKIWTKSVFTKVHTHDIRALALLGRKAKHGGKSVLVSGGVDTSIVIYNNVKSFAESSNKRIPPFAQMSDIYLASEAELIMYQRQTSLDFWKLGKPVNEEFLHLAENPSHLLQIEAKGPHHIICSAISHDAVWTAYSDINHLCLFKLSIKPSTTDVTVQRMKCLPDNIIPAHHMKFTRDTSKLITVSNEKTIQIIDLLSQPMSVETMEFPSPTHNEINQREAESRSPVSVLALNEEGTLCACSDTTRYINVFDIKKSKHLCTLPRFASYVTAMAFQPGTNTLIMATHEKELFMFNLTKMKMTDLTSSSDGRGLPSQWRLQPAKVTSILFDRRNPTNIILHSNDMITLIDPSKPLPLKNEKLFITHKDKRNATRHKRKHAEIGGVDKNIQEKEGICEQPTEPNLTKCEGMRVCRKYKPLLFLGINEDNSMVVVERSWLSIMDTLPPTLHRKKYGT